MFPFRSHAAQLEKAIAAHLKISKELRALALDAEAEVELVERDITDLLSKSTALKNTALRAHRVAGKIEELLS